MTGIQGGNLNCHHRMLSLTVAHSQRARRVYQSLSENEERLWEREAALTDFRDFARMSDVSAHGRMHIATLKLYAARCAAIGTELQ